MKTRSATTLRARLLAFLMSTALLAVILPSAPASAAGNQAIQLNGSSQYLTMGASPGLRSSQFTVELWFKRTGAGVGTSTGTGGIASAIPLITKGRAEAETAAADINYFFGIDATTGQLVADFEEAQSGASPSLNHPVTGTTVVTSNVWHHAAATYDGTTWNLYLDGNLDKTLAINAPANTAVTSATAIGSALTTAGVAAGFFQGQIDEARIWSTARSQGQIQSTMNTEIGATAGLAGLWHMNEGSGTTTADASGGGNTGTLTAGPTWVAGAPFDTTPPAAPLNLTAGGSPGAVNMSWSANTEADLAGYNVYRATSAGVPTSGTPLNGATPQVGTTYTDLTGTPGTPFFYVVTAVDTSGNGSASSNEVTATPQVVTNSAIQLNGSSQYLTMGASPGLRSSQFTVELWFKRTGAGVGTSTGTGGIASAIPLITKGRAEAETAAADINYFFGIDATTGQLVADFEEAQSGASPSLNHPVTGTTVVTSNVWHHAAATYDGTTWNLYLDGNLDKTLAINAPANTAVTSATAIGSALTTAGVAAGFFQGQIDEARIWSTARSQGQIQSTMNTEIGATAGLAGLWHMNEGSGTTTADASGGGNTGTLTAGPTWVAGFPISSDTTAPAAPQNLVATPGAGNVGLSWSANGEVDLAGYNVYRSTTPGVPVAGLPLNGGILVTGTSLTDSSVIGGTTYYYIVTAVDTSNNASGASNEASATPTAPSSGLQLNGTNQYVTFGAAPGLDSSTFTLELWFKRTGAGVGTSTGSGGVPSAIPLLTKGRSENDGSNVDMNYFLGIDSATGKLVADFEEGAGQPTPGLNHPIFGNTVVTSNVWHHAAATYDGSAWHLYLDGNADGVLAVGNFPRSDSIQHAAIGTAMNSTGVADGFFAGVVDEARIWNVARTQSQIQAGRNLEIPSAQGLIGRWGMNEGTGSIVSDSSGSGINGTAVNAPAWVNGAPFNPDSSPPAPPQGLVAMAGGGQVSLTWNPNSEPDLAGYNVYRATSPGVSVNGTPVNGGTLVSGTSFTDTGVSGGTDYYYVVTAIDQSSNASTASNEVLATPTAGDPVLVGAGDIADCANVTDEATAALVNQIPGQVFTLGDNVYPNGTLTEFQNCYGASWGQFLARTRPVSGNHEYNTANAAGYFGYFGAAAGSPSTGYYSYDVDSHWHVVVLNSECAQVGGCEAGSPQEQWLRADLAANADKNVIAMWHKPLFSSNANNTFMQDIWQALYDFGADIVLNGHAHGYERFAPQTATGVANSTYGIKEFVVGTGGESHQAFTQNQPNTEVRDNVSFGVMKLTLHPSSYDWQFIPIPGATFTDSGTASVHGAPPNTPPVVDSVVVNPAAPTTDQTITATVTSHDPEGQAVTLSYQWLKNGSPIGGATGSTLDLGTVGNGDRGDQLSVRVTASDGVNSSTPVTSSNVTVQNAAPSATVALSPAPPSTNQTVTATSTRTDADADGVTLTYVWKVNGVVVKTTGATASLTDSLDLSVAGNGDDGDAISVEVTPNDGTVSGTLVSAATVVSAAVVSAVPDSTFQVNGRVNALVRVGNVVYIGGDFTQLLGHNGEIVPRQYLAAIDATTGQPMAWDPGADGVVQALAASPDGTTIYAGGQFKHVATLTRTRIAAIDATTGAVRSWSPTVSSLVRTIVTLGNRVYVGGQFTTVAGQGGANTARLRLAAFDATNGSLTTWDPSVDQSPRDMLVTPDGRIIVVGDFTTVGGAPSNFIAALDATTGALLPWSGHPSDASQGITQGPGRVFVGVGTGAAGNQVVAFDINTGAQLWLAQGDGDVTDVAYMGGVVYAGGHFDNMSGQPRGRLAAFNPSTGALRADWTPTVNTNIAVVAMIAAGSKLYVGGGFTIVTGVNQQRYAVFSGAPPANTPPVVDSVVIDQSSPGTNATLSATVAAHDADGNPLTLGYQWTRNGTDIAGATAAVLDMSIAGRGDKGDLIRLRVTANDGTANSSPLTSAPVTVGNTAPSATVALDSHTPGTNAVLQATGRRH